MPDFRKVVQKHFSGSSLDVQTQQEIVDEVADHLTDIYDAHRDGGQAPEQAASAALGQVGDWKTFCKDVVRAKEHAVDRIKTVLVPGLAALALTILSDKCVMPAVTPHLKGVYSYLFTFTNADLIRSTILVFPWYLTLPFCGATGAYLARRAGANVVRRIAAATFPAWFLGIVFLATGVAEKPASILRLYAIALVAMPALALFVGAIPFLRQKSNGSEAHGGLTVSRL